VARAKNMAEIDDIVSAWTIVRAKDEVLRLLNEAHVPCAPVKTAREVAHDPHLEARGFWVDIDHPRRGRTRVPISAIRLHAGGKPEIRSPAPTLGQHTETVLAELLGLKAEELATLRAQRVTEPVR
jgi:CoA:oxalate CoA-transferase